jgi:hypothetical protein
MKERLVFMEFYSTWLYRYVLNAEWAIWTFVVTIMGLNLLSPIFIWMIMNGSPVTKWLKKRMKKKQEEIDSKST